jgi:hypothetical protein
VGALTGRLEAQSLSSTRADRSQVAQSPVETEAMIARTVCLQRPQSDPAPHALATSLHVDAPRDTASVTSWLVAPVHRQTYIHRPRFDPTSPAKQVRLTYVKPRKRHPAGMTAAVRALH